MQAEAEAGGVPGQGDGLLSEPMVVPAEWLDLYGHMNAARYFQVFIDTGYALLGRLGLGDAYTRSQRRGIFLVDARIHYQHELRLGSRIHVRLRVLAVDARRLQVLLEMLDDQGRVAAHLQQLFVHVDLEARRPTPFGQHLQQVLRDAADRHGRLPVPRGVERSLDWRSAAG